MAWLWSWSEPSNSTLLCIRNASWHKYDNCFFFLYIRAHSFLMLNVVVLLVETQPMGGTKDRHCVRLRSVQVLSVTSSACEKQHLRNFAEAVGFVGTVCHFPNTCVHHYRLKPKRSGYMKGTEHWATENWHVSNAVAWQTSRMKFSISFISWQFNMLHYIVPPLRITVKVAHSFYTTTKYSEKQSNCVWHWGQKNSSNKIFQMEAYVCCRLIL